MDQVNRFPSGFPGSIPGVGVFMIDRTKIPEIRELQRQMREKFKAVPPEGQIVDYLGRKFIVYTGVFWPHEDSKAIVKNMTIRPGETVLDICTGSGVIAIFAALKGAKKVVALDINPEAVRSVKENAKMNGVSRKVDARVSDMFAALEPGEKFDVITMNPPFTDHPAENFIEKTMWDNDFHVHKEFFKYGGALLKENGRIYMSQASFANVEKMLQMAKDNKFTIKKIGENKVDNIKTFYAFELRKISAED